MVDVEKIPEVASVDRTSEIQPSTGSDVERLPRRVTEMTSESDHTQVVVEVHPAARGGQCEALGDRQAALDVRSSAPDLHLLTSTAFGARVAHASEPRRKRQFVVVAANDDVRRLTTKVGVHRRVDVHRSGSCTLPAEMRSPRTTARFVMSLTNLDVDTFSSDIVLPHCRPTSTSTSLQPVLSLITSGCSSDQASSASKDVEVPSSLAWTSVDRNWREVSKELWSLRALLANHEDTSVEESTDEAMAVAASTTAATTPQSADDVSVKSSADTVISVGDRPLSAASMAAATTTTVTSTVADPQPPSAAVAQAGSGDDGVTRKPSIRRQNYREAIARRQNNRLKTAVIVADSNELSIPTSSVEGSSEPTDTESSLSFERCTHAGSLVSSNDTTASSFCDSMTSTDSTAGGSGSDGHGGGHRLEQLRGDSGYRSLEAQQSLGQTRDFRRQSASHFLLDSSTNVIYEDQMVTTASSDDVRAPASPSSVAVSIQQMQYSTAVGVPIPVSTSTADCTAASRPANMRSGHRHNKAAQRKRIQYRCERQAVEIHDSVVVGDPVECKATHHSRHHHRQYYQQQQQQQSRRRSTDAVIAAEGSGERCSLGTTTTTTTTATTKPSLFSRLLRTAHVGSGTSASAGVASRRSSLVRMQRDYSIDERSSAIFNEFLRHDPAYDAKHTLSVHHSQSSRPARRSRGSRSPMPSRGTPAARRHLTVEEHDSAELLSVEAHRGAQRQRDDVFHSAPNTATTSPLLTRKHLLVEVRADPRVSSTTPLLGHSPLRDSRRRSEGNSRLIADVTTAIVHRTDNDRRRATVAGTSVDWSPPDDRSSSGAEQTTAESGQPFPPRRDDDADAGAVVGEVRRPSPVSTSSQHGCQRRTSHSIPVIQLTTDDDTLQ